VVGYAYDAVGNRTSLTLNGVTTTNTFNAGDRLTSSDSGAVSYGYDDNGNLTSRTEGGVTTTYAYDALNRLTGVSSGGVTSASYSSNGDGLRVSKTVGGVTTPFTWDPTGIGTLLGDGDRYLWGHGPIGRIDANSIATYAHQDGLGSVRLITDATGAVVGSSAYDAFGAQRATSGVPYRLGYTGEQLDAETGFVYLRARYLDPALGRFTAADTVQPNAHGTQGYNRHSDALPASSSVSMRQSLRVEKAIRCSPATGPGKRSSSLARRRKRLRQAKERSTTQCRGKSTKPVRASGRLATSKRIPQPAAACSASCPVWP
jgi:RHS repeat-associated protein